MEKGDEVTVQELIATHPHPTSVDREALLRCIDDCFDCEQSCNDLLTTIPTPERS